MPPSINPIQEQLQRLEAQAASFEPLPSLPPEPPGPLWRKLRSCPAPDYATRAPPSLEAARALIRTEIQAYLDLPAPEHMLLIRTVPGVGKTTAAVEAAEACAARGWRVMYAGPRHDFFDDVTAMAAYPRIWYEWLPRTDGGETMPRTCEWTADINGWLQKGYEGIDFCAKVCGWDYINTRCKWHRQKLTDKPVIFVQHQHVSAGHPLEFRVLIGDENPLAAFLHRWNIPAKRVVPGGMDYAEPLTEILLKLSGLCAGELISGLQLMDALGGPAAVLEACEMFVMPASALAAADIHSAGDAERADFFHLPQLVPLLAREARAAADDRLYPARVIAGKGDLTLLLRRWPDQRLPQHIIWLDATGNEHIYETLFGRPVDVVDAAPKLEGSITVVTDRANGKGDFKTDQAAQLVRKIVADCGHQNPAVVTFQGAEAEIAGAWLSAHFYGARGTNRLEQCDALFVVGAPMPNREVIKDLGAMLYFERMITFESPWTAKYVPYRYTGPDGLGCEYPAGGFWSDEDLQALVWQLREAEILQAVHRARPVHRTVPIYLLSNLPIAELPVQRLATAAELLGAPDRTDAFAWDHFMTWVGGRESVTAGEIQAALHLTENTAIKYRDALASMPGWELAAQKTGSRGRPAKVVIRQGISLTDTNRALGNIRTGNFPH